MALAAGPSARWETAPSAAGVIATVLLPPVMCAELMHAAWRYVP
ncbi:MULTISPECIES: hypothetical protein [Streptomyces]|nr:hypothetical protein [Streptomyces durhamensis]